MNEPPISSKPMKHYDLNFWNTSKMQKRYVLVKHNLVSWRSKQAA